MTYGIPVTGEYLQGLTRDDLETLMQVMMRMITLITMMRMMIT